MIQDLPALLWVVNLGCIDLNEWYARWDDVDRPDYLHFDLDPGPEATYDQVLDTALLVHEALDALGMPNYAKTTGSRGIHVYVPIVRGPNQKEVWTFAKAFAQTLEERRKDLVTAVYKIAKRPEGPRARRLQPERVGEDARLGLLGAADGRTRPSRRRSRGTRSRRACAIEDFTTRERARARRRKLAISGSRVGFEADGRFKLESIL